MVEVNTPETPKHEIENKAKVLVVGTFGADDIEVKMTDHRMPKNPELEAEIEAKWTGRRSEPLTRVESYKLTEDGKLVLELGETEYKEYYGSRALATLRKYRPENIANPLSASTVIITSDNKLIIAQKVSGDATGSIDVTGGYVHRVKDLDPKTKVIDVFKAAKREVLEETGVDEDKIEEILCLGLSYEYANLCHPVISFLAKTSLTFAEIEELKRLKELKDPGTKEINLILVEPERIPYSSDDNYVLNILRKNYPNIEPDGRVSIALARRWLAGKFHQKQVKRQISQI